MSLRRPTVAPLLFTFDISPLCDVAQTSDCGTHCHLYSIISPLCGVALTPDCGIVNLFALFLRSHFRHSIDFQYYIGILGGLPPDFSVISPCNIVSMPERTCHSALMLHVCICYILCPNCLASTFIVLTWLVDLARC